jgi:hypothetical protein
MFVVAFGLEGGEGDGGYVCMYIGWVYREKD